uniref:Uncharacterized protein n=1 Tax=uncultured marine virus TaxID=186617 RepID=A0A0F7L6V3_9VIRU|nr:hypothetical protein [uncultured marine virus]
MYRFLLFLKLYPLLHLIRLQHHSGLLIVKQYHKSYLSLFLHHLCLAKFQQQLYKDLH